MPPPAWLEAVQQRAPDTVAVWRTLEGRLESNAAFRRELSARAGPGSAERVLAEQEAVADALADALAACTEEVLRAPGGEEDWNVAQAFAHTTAARRWLVSAAAMAARGEWPADEPLVQPGIPGPADASRELLATYLAKSRRSMALSASAIAGHETQPCPLDHPLVGFLTCGAWLLFVGVHDLMHLEQVHALIDGA
ncbi:MAG TPA: DinB family protein [Candidatus Limnocylindria bacterium]|nr:DinB family protein [Candidatus Limnocylindria bacterium]